MISRRDPVDLGQLEARRTTALAALSAGSGVYAVARQVGVAPSVVRAWRSQAGDLGEPMSAHRTDFLGESIDEFIDGSFQAISAMLATTQDAAWLRRQSAGDLAIYLGVLSDRVIMVLDRIAAARTRRTT